MQEDDTAFNEQLEALRADFMAVRGEPFKHFFCPLLHRDDETPLSKGHLVPKALKSSPRWVIQRTDVDNFYGYAFEADLVAMIKSHGKSNPEILLDPELRKKMKPKITMDGQTVKHYIDHGDKVPDHYTLVEFQGKGQSLPIVLCQPGEEAGDIRNKKWQIECEFDCRAAGVASILKAGYLTLFRVLRYSFALSPGGIFIGKEVLGSFYEKYRGATPIEAKEAAREHFKNCVNMLRPMKCAGQTPPMGTAEDGIVGVCVRRDKDPYALIVFVRTIDRLHAVLLPFFDDVHGAVAYHKATAGEIPVLTVATGRFEQNKHSLKVVERYQELQWGREDPYTALAAKGDD